MDHIFRNHGYLLLAALAVALPIIIHLINRLRFKRIRWAAMEFLLKAQKKSRKRLILEQLLLLLLRCLLVGLIGFLVVRFMGMNEASKEALRKTVHFVVLDDSLSMRDTHHKRGKTAFEYAKELFIEKVAKEVRGSGADDQIILIEASRTAQGETYQPLVFEQLFDASSFNEMESKVGALQPTLLHVNLSQVLSDVHERIKKLPEAQLYLHILSDFRHIDWGDKNGEALHKTIQEMVDGEKKVKVQLLDASDWQGFGYPRANPNVAITEFLPEVKVAAKGMRVAFTVEVRNFSAEPAVVDLKIFDGLGGKELFDAAPTMRPSQPMKVSPKASEKVRFEVRFNPEIGEGKSLLVPIVAVLKNLNNDDVDKKEGIDLDNTRIASVEIRNQVPILILDGDAGTGKAERDLDSFELANAVKSLPGENYVPVNAETLTGSVAVKALERTDLHRYPVILLTNIRELNEKQRENLEKYVRNGGGLAFFMGPSVSPKYYNDKLYAEGKGLFPAPLKTEYTPPSNEPPREAEFTGYPQLLVRQDLYPDEESYPIFGRIDPRAFTAFAHFPVFRYFQIDTAKWNKEKGKVFELATLPNDAPIGKYQGAALAITKDPRLLNFLDGEAAKMKAKTDPSFAKYVKYAKYAAPFNKSFERIRAIVAPGSSKKAQHLSFELDHLLSDKGTGKKDEPTLAEFWSTTDPLVEGEIAEIKEGLVNFRNELRYGDPLVMGRQFGSGKVIAVMTSAGKVWQNWAGGSGSTHLYPTFIFEMLSFLSSASGETSLLVGTPVRINLEKSQFAGKEPTLDHVFSYVDDSQEGDKKYALKDIVRRSVAPDESDELLRFAIDKNLDPGQSKLTLAADDEALKKNPLWFWYVFNLDAVKEGNLERVSPTDIEDKLIGPDRKTKIVFVQPHGGRSSGQQSVLDAGNDYSESPYLYLIILVVLVLEQAMAVHLSYHLRGSETESLSRLTKPSAVPDQIVQV
jgi:hypothetical protein